MKKLSSQLSVSNSCSRPTVLHTVLLCCFSVSSFPVFVTADENKLYELDQVKEKITDVKSQLDEARSESDRLQEDLKQTEISAGREALRLKGLNEQIQKHRHRLAELESIIIEHESIIKNEQEQLAHQIRAAYLVGRSDYLKLLLNQEDPTRVGRVLAYYDYYNRSRTQSIQSIREKLDLIAELKNNIESETIALENLKDRQLERRVELENYRRSRSEILKSLKTDIDRKDSELKTLEEHKQKLSALLEQLDRKESIADSVEYFQGIPPFNSMKGKLDWPIPGQLLNKFGSNRRGESLRWQGVRISGNAGDEVQAIHSGKVIFADWFRNLGLLVILDHGNGYMSLYGNNQNLLKKPGDLVLAGEAIAYVGDSGGQPIPGVYFEIRFNGKPLNPAFWCRR